MQNIDELLEQVSRIATNPTSPGATWFTSLDLKYAYGQLFLDRETSEQFNFSIVCGKATGTYRSPTAFYGLPNMHADFPRTMDALFLTLPSNFAFMDDIMVVTRSPVQEHMKQFYGILKVLDDGK